MAGKRTSIPEMWKTLKKGGLELEDPVPLNANVYLGCGQRDVVPNFDLLLQKREYFGRLCAEDKSSGESYAQGDLEHQSSTSSNLPKKNTSNISEFSSRGREASAQFYAYEMFGHVEQTVDRYCELAKKSKDSLKKVATPCPDDHLIAPEEFTKRGELAPVAARIVLKALYVARIARLDLLWSVNALAREVTRWNAACDRRLHRLISYMHHTRDLSQLCYVGDPPDKCFMTYFSDASFAGDLRDSKSTSGGILCLVGPNTFVPINWLCKKQGAVSHSTSEAEVIALEAGARMEGLPALLLWDIVVDVLCPGGPGAKKISIQRQMEPQSIYEMFRSLDEISAICSLVPTNFKKHPGSSLILSNSQSKFTRCVRATCLSWGLRPLTTILITASLSSRRKSRPRPYEIGKLGGT